jgi:hypothetical protein
MRHGMSAGVSEGLPSTPQTYPLLHWSGACRCSYCSLQRGGLMSVADPPTPLASALPRRLPRVSAAHSPTPRPARPILRHVSAPRGNHARKHLGDDTARCCAPEAFNQGLSKCGCLRSAAALGVLGSRGGRRGTKSLVWTLIPKVAQIAYATGLLGIAYNPFCHHGVNIELAGLHVAPIVLGIICLD